MKKIFTLLSLLLMVVCVSAQITTKTWDFSAITDAEITALTSKSGETAATFKSGSGYICNVAAGTSTKGDVNYVVKDAAGNEISTTEGIIFGRSGDVIKAEAFRIYTGTKKYIYFNHKNGVVRLPSIKAGQEVVVTNDSYTSTVTVTNSATTSPTVSGNSFDFIVSADGTVDITFADKPSITSIVVRNPVTKYTITYDLGSATAGTVPTQSSLAEGKTFTVAAAPADLEAPTGQEFKCWNDGANDYDPGDTYTIGTSNVTLTAQYQAITTKYTITYSLGAGTGTAPTQEELAEGKTFTVAAAPADLVAPTGQEFKCWNDGSADFNAGATYTVGTANIILTAVYQEKTYKGLTPTTTLDLSKATSTSFTTVWYSANNVTKDCYYDASNGVVTFLPFAIYSENNSGNKTQTWATTDSGSSTSATWETTGVFKGSSYYFSSSAKSATVRNAARMHYFRVTNCTAVSALMGGKAIIEAYTVTAGVVSPDPVKENTITAAGTLSLTDLDKDTEYIIKVYGDNGNSNVTFQEIAFTFPAVTSVAITPAKALTTYVTTNVLDFTGLDIKAYTVTATKATSVTLTEVTKVPAGTPLVLQGTASTTYNVPVIASADAVSGNKLQGSATESYTVTADGDAYVLSDGEFHPAQAGTIAAGKAYLLKADIPEGAREFMALDFDDVTGISSIKNDAVKAEDNTYYDLNGRRVLYPTKGLYIINGKKVVIK